MKKIYFLVLLFSVFSCTSKQKSKSPKGVELAPDKGAMAPASGVSPSSKGVNQTSISQPNPSTLPTPPKPPQSKNNTNKCTNDEECTFAFQDPCSIRCPSCGKVWKSVSNKKSYKEFQNTWAIKVPHCTCQVNCQHKTIWLGTKTFCKQGYCDIQ
jgi:hypothetical protein